MQKLLRVQFDPSTNYKTKSSCSSHFGTNMQTFDPLRQLADAVLVIGTLPYNIMTLPLVAIDITFLPLKECSTNRVLVSTYHSHYNSFGMDGPWKGLTLSKEFMHVVFKL